MIETYRMLGREHEADLLREAKRREQASLVRRNVRRRRWLSIWKPMPAPPSAITAGRVETA